VKLFALRYSDVGGTATGILHTAVSDPVALMGTIATPDKALYLVLLLGPFLGLWLLEPLLALGAAPDLAINLLSSTTGVGTLELHYNAGIVPFLFAASIFGIKKLKRDPERLSTYLLAGLASLALFGPIFLARSDTRGVFVEPAPDRAGTLPGARPSGRSRRRNEPSRRVPLG
jgi:uncharacterized membrane protein